MSTFFVQLKQSYIYSSTYESILILEDFNGIPSNVEVSSFISDFSLYSLINPPTCFRLADGRYFGLMLTNKKHIFKRVNLLKLVLVTTII